MRDTPGFSRVGRMSNFMPGANENGGTEELYDLYLDPMKACNRIHDPDCAAIRDDLAQRLEDGMEAKGDCFPSGEFPEPPASKS